MEHQKGFHQIFLTLANLDWKCGSCLILPLYQKESPAQNEDFKKDVHFCHLSKKNKKYSYRLKEFIDI